MNEENVPLEQTEQTDLAEVTESINTLVEVMETEQQLQAEEQAKLEEEQSLQQASLEEEQQALETEATAEEEYRQSVLNALNSLNANLEEQETLLIEIKDIEQQTYQLQKDMSGHLVYGADSLIIYACLIPLFFIVKVLSGLFRRFI